MLTRLLISQQMLMNFACGSCHIVVTLGVETQMNIQFTGEIKMHIDCISTDFNNQRDGSDRGTLGDVLCVERYPYIF